MRKRLSMNIWRSASLPDDWRERGTVRDRSGLDLESYVNAIIEDVKTRRDAALIEYASRFDNVALDAQTIRITQEEIEESYEKVSQEQISALEFMKQRIAKLEARILREIETEIEEDGVRIRSLPRPIESVGCYVPGGQAAYPSTLTMTVVPAKVAGVPRVVVCSPPTSNGTVNPLVLVAADICHVDEIYKVGGAHAIAAMAYGTESIKPVMKIVGPGNRYVTMAKRLICKDVPIDMPAGPTEIVVLADDAADPRLIAVDMISQAEHGPESVVGLITTSEQLAESVLNELNEMDLPARGQIIARALSECGFIVICESVHEMIKLTNDFAPEHVEIMTEKPNEIAERLTTAGLILIGPYSPVSGSDYCYGTNHVLPTGGSGRTFSGLSVLDFVKWLRSVQCSKDGLLKVKNIAKVMATAENLPSHYAAIEERFTLEDAG